MYALWICAFVINLFVSFTYVFIEVQNPLLYAPKIVFSVLFHVQFFVLISCKYLRMWVFGCIIFVYCTFSHSIWFINYADMCFQGK